MEEKRRAAAEAKREAEEEAQRTAELEEKAGARAEAGTVPPAPKPSPWKGVGPAKWIVLAAVALLLVGGISYAVYQSDEQQRVAEEVASQKAEEERQEAERRAAEE